MGEIDGLSERVEAARSQFGALQVAGWGEPGPADAETGERWDRGNVLGHVAEMLPYWTEQFRAVLAGAGDMGRDAEGGVRRREGIDDLRHEGEDALLRRLDQGLDGVLALLADMNDADLDRRITYHGHTDRQISLREAMEQLLVGHLEAHIRQLHELSPTE